MTESEKKKKYYQKNKKRILETVSQYYERNKVDILAKQRIKYYNKKRLERLVK
jgi:hypothetical protein